MNSKKISITSLILLAVAATIAGGCKTPVVVIAHGASFGHCVGYCKKELSVSVDSLTYVQSKNGDQPATKTCVQPLKKQTYEELIKDFDFKYFQQSDAVIGCPDCADGGAEWLEVTAGKTKKRVTFEYRNAPEKFKSMIEKLNKLQSEMEDCKSK